MSMCSMIFLLISKYEVKTNLNFYSFAKLAFITEKLIDLSHFDLNLITILTPNLILNIQK